MRWQCPECGGANYGSVLRCVCGYELSTLHGGSSEAAIDISLPQTASARMGYFNEHEVRAFIGKEADYYLKKWQPILEGRSQRAGFNWAAFLLTGLWLPYRKMFKWAFIFCGIILIENFLKFFYTFGLLFTPEPPIALDILEGLMFLATNIICGTFGNIWYLSHTRKAISEIRRQGWQDEAYLQSLSKSGGTSLSKSLGFFILYCQSGILGFFLSTFASGLMHSLAHI